MSWELDGDTATLKSIRTDELVARTVVDKD